MQSKFQLIPLYRAILECWGLTSDEAGYISVKSMDDDDTPALIEGKRLVLPTQQQLSNGDMGARMFFHPLMENVLRGESVVMSKLRTAVNIRLNFIFASIGGALLQICASTAEHSKLSPQQQEVLSAIKDVDQKTCEQFTSLMVAAVTEAPDRTFTNIFLKRRMQTASGKVYDRGGVVTFPVYEELIKDQEKYKGVRLRAKDRTAFLALYSYIFPQLNQKEAYDRGSESRIAPFMDALMKTGLALASPLNDVLDLFGDLIDGSEFMRFNADWVEAFENVDALAGIIRTVPMQSGNDGAVKLAEVVTTNASIPALHYSAPVNDANLNLPSNAGIRVPLAGIGFQPAMVQHPQVGQPVQMVQNYGVVGQPTQYQHQPPRVVETERGVRWDSLVNASPALAARLASTPNYMYQGRPPVNPRDAEPSWARQQSNQGFGSPYQNNQQPQMSGYGYNGSGINLV